jgi:hypothetical protein
MTTTYTHFSDLAKEVQPPDKGILSRTLSNKPNSRAGTSPGGSKSESSPGPCEMLLPRCFEPDTAISGAISSTARATAARTAKARTIAKDTRKPCQPKPRPRTMTSQAKTGKAGGSGPQQQWSGGSGLPRPRPPESRRLMSLPNQQGRKRLEPHQPGSKPTRTRLANPGGGRKPGSGWWPLCSPCQPFQTPSERWVASTRLLVRRNSGRLHGQPRRVAVGKPPRRPVPPPRLAGQPAAVGRAGRTRGRSVTCARPSRPSGSACLCWFPR